jgi:hypothetical protein
MQRGLSRKLRQGRSVLNADLSASVYAKRRNADLLDAGVGLCGGAAWGYFFDRIVCLYYEKLGYEVEERSCLGYQDRGVDLAALNARASNSAVGTTPESGPAAWDAGLVMMRTRWMVLSPDLAARTRCGGSMAGMAISTAMRFSYVWSPTTSPGSRFPAGSCMQAASMNDSTRLLVGRYPGWRNFPCVLPRGRGLPMDC